MRGRVIIRRMVDNLAERMGGRGRTGDRLFMPDRRGRHNDALARKAGGHERGKRLVAKGTKEGTLVADVRQCATMRERENAEYRELHEIIEYMDEKQVWIRGHDGTITNADGRSPGNLGRSNVRRSRIWTRGSRR